MLTRSFPTEPPTANRRLRSHPLSRHLAGAWLFNEGAGRTLHDRSGHHRQGTFSGGPLWQPSRYGHALAFDGDDDWVSMGDCLDLGTDDISVLAIVRFSATQPDTWQGSHYAAIAGKGYLSSNSRGYGLYIYEGRIGWQVRNLGTSRAPMSNDMLNDGQYHIVVGVCDRDSTTGLRLYVDGVRQAQTLDPTILDGVDLSGTESFAIGSRHDANGTWYWDLLGSVAAVCVWKRVLTDSEILALRRDPWALFAVGRLPRHVSSPSIVTVPLSGSIHCVSSVTARLSLPAEKSALLAKAAWQADALFHGMTARACQLGTVLTGGWFWTRRNGCQVVYRGPSLDEIDFDTVLHVADLAASQLSLPAWVSHAPGETWCYLVQRFNAAGYCERTTAASVTVRLGPDGQLADPIPNPVGGLDVRQTDGTTLTLTWSYDPLDQHAAPERFNVYWDGGTGQLDMQDPIASLEYKGRRFYSYACNVPAEGDYTFTVRAQTAAGAESVASPRVNCQVRAAPPPPPTLLVAEAI